MRFKNKVLLLLLLGVMLLPVLAGCGTITTSEAAKYNEELTATEDSGQNIDPSKEGTCTMTVECATILDNMNSLKENKKDIVPEDGVIFPRQEVTFYEGETVFDVLNRVMQENKIHLDFSYTPLYESQYVKGISNLYEFDCGELSGWMFSVNDWYPNYGASKYIVSEGDNIQWRYTCDLGEDIGGGISSDASGAR